MLQSHHDDSRYRSIVVPTEPGDEDADAALNASSLLDPEVSNLSNVEVSAATGLLPPVEVRDCRDSRLLMNLVATLQHPLFERRTMAAEGGHPHAVIADGGRSQTTTNEFLEYLTKKSLPNARAQVAAVFDSYDPPASGAGLADVGGAMLGRQLREGASSPTANALFEEG